MKRTLYPKLLGSYVLLAIISILVVTLLTSNLMVKNARQSQAEMLYQEATEVANNYAKRVFAKDVPTSTIYSIQEELEVLTRYNNAHLMVVRPDGELLIHSADSSYLYRALAGDAYKFNNFDITSLGNEPYYIGDLAGLYDRDHLVVYSTLTYNFTVMGYVIVAQDLSGITMSTNRNVQAVLISVGIVFIASFLILLFFNIFVYRPLRKITNVAINYAQGDFSSQINVRSSDEMGYLANTLNYMAEELDKQEAEQRKFISNVSHDFRSPLTSIKGYCEAMVDGTIPVEMQERYLNIILSETERLNKLTQSLLDLNQFGHHELRLDIADFDINQMIRQVLLTFEGVCGKKGITIDLVLTGEELFVTADMTKIQQVLYNLIDNAIKFSHQDSSIKIETSIKKEKVFVSVKDYGIGIPADSVKKVWERFYKTDASRGRDKRGVGLGLAIVKEIITTHKQTIDVISTEGAGTEFIFTLALSEKSK